MTEKELRDCNPWKTMVLHELYSSDEDYVIDGDRSEVFSFNDRIGDDVKNRLILNVPPEPWQGNPLKAKVIFLTLNPGYVERVNKKLAKILQRDSTVLKRMLHFKMQTLRLEATSFMPSSNDEEPIGFRDSISMLGDWYWEDRLKMLLDVLRENDKNYTMDKFYEKVAIIQYHAYTSEKYEKVFPPRGKSLVSQDYTKKLIGYIADNNPDTIFVIMRSVSRWKDFLGEPILSKLKDRMIIKDNKGMSQAISPNNLGKLKFELICNALK